jgi:hypothetical protein
MVGHTDSEPEIGLFDRLRRDLNNRSRKHPYVTVTLRDDRTVVLDVGKVTRMLRVSYYHQVLASMMAHHGWSHPEALEQVQVTINSTTK